MYKVIIFGTGKTSMIVESGLNCKVNIIYYCDNDETKWEKIHKGILVINPEKIKDINFDYIIIASQYEYEIYNQLKQLGIENKKIFQFFKYIDLSYNYIERQLDEWLYESNQELNLVATGISYMEKALDIKSLCKRAIKLSNHSQDLYFDYNLIKYLLENYSKHLINLKYVFIGISYYSFEYDMSKSAMKGKVLLYDEVLGLNHNLKEIDEMIESKEINSVIATKIFKFDEIGCIEINWFNNKLNIMKIDGENGKRQALLDGNKNYPKTVEENTQIFKDYLKLLQDNCIKPIVIVCPVSKYYSKYFPERIRNEFRSIIKQTKEEYGYQFIDYFDSDIFEDDDFYDVSHLNCQGAKKFTKVLNEIVEW